MSQWVGKKWKVSAKEKNCGFSLIALATLSCAISELKAEAVGRSAGVRGPAPPLLWRRALSLACHCLEPGEHCACHQPLFRKRSFYHFYGSRCQKKLKPAIKEKFLRLQWTPFSFPSSVKVKAADLTICSNSSSLKHGNIYFQCIQQGIRDKLYLLAFL